jgi:hypothetical protein
VLDRDGGILDGEFVIPSSANYQRFCSNFMATREHGFDRPIIFTNEEATDVVNRTGIAWPATPANGSNPEQAGVVVAFDVNTGAYKTIYGMGRHNHENSVAIPGYKKLVVLSGDDTFSPPASQLYSYIANSTDDLWNDRGDLWAFVSDNPAINDYGDLSGSASVSGHFIKVPKDVATGSTNPTTAQTVLENWSNANNVFQFIRVEDIAYDREDSNIVYFADTGEPRALPDATTGRLRRGPAIDPATGQPTIGPWPNGRIFKMVLDKRDPTKVKKLSILVDGDKLGAAGAGNTSLIHQPDNIETTKDALLIQEDPGGHNQYALTDPNGTTARIWKHDLYSKSLKVVAKVNQSLDNLAGYDKAPTTTARAGGWESSGIIDVSRFFGDGWFLVDIQAGSLILESETRPDGITYEREGGQLLLVKIPGT